MARSGKNKLRSWEYPAGSGIRVREIINRSDGEDFGLSYLRVAIELPEIIVQGGRVQKRCESPRKDRLQWISLSMEVV